MNDSLMQIRETIKDIPYSLDQQLINDGIDAIFEEVKNIVPLDKVCYNHN